MTDAASTESGDAPTPSDAAVGETHIAQAETPDEAAGQAVAREPAACEIPGANVVDVPVPPAGERISVAVQPGDIIRLACSFRDVAGTEVGDTLEMTFPGGGVVIVENFSAWIAAQGAAVSDCLCGDVNLAEFIAGIGLVPEDVLPAAGTQGGPQGDDLTGSGFRAGPGPEILSGYPYPNILDPTALGYGAPEPDETFRAIEDAAADSRDGVPIARDNAIDAVTNSVNLVIVFDRSGSMDENPNAPGFTTRIDLARAAVASMLAAYESVANINVLIVDFASTAANSGWLNSASAANAYLAGLDALGETHYDEAIQEAISSYNSGLPDAGQTLVYFVSDGKPFPANTSLAATGTVDDWENFLIDQGIDRAFAIGMGLDVSGADADLADVAFPNDNPNNVIIIANESDTFDALVTTVVEAGGNVLTDAPADDFGPDGPGSPAIVSIEVDGSIYRFDGTQITLEGAVVVPGSTLIVVTALGGELTFNFANGNYAYDVTGPGVGGQEAFTYTIADSDGDTSSATITINLDDLQVAQPNRVFGTAGNNGDLIGSAGIDIIGGGDGNDFIDAGDGDDHISGGAGADTIFGGGGDDVIIGGNQGEVTDRSGTVRPGGADLGDLVDGGDGDDVIYGNEGNDTLRGGAGNDTIVGEAGNDVITGGEGDDVINLSGGGNDVVQYSSPLDGHDLVLNFSADGDGQDYFDLDPLFDLLGVATADRAARVQIVDRGSEVDIKVDADGDNSNGFELTVATLMTTEQVTIGTSSVQDVQLGTL